MAEPNIIISIAGSEISDHYEDMRLLKVYESVASPTLCNLHLALQRGSDGRWNLLEADGIQLWQKLEVEVVFPGQEAELLFSGYVAQLLPVLPEKVDECVLEIVSMDPSCLMDRQDKVKLWHGQTDGEIVSAIFSDYGFDVQPDCQGDAWELDENPLIQRSTDWRFVTDIADRLGYECFFKAKTPLFRKPAFDASPVAPLFVHFGDRTNLNHLEIEQDGLAPRAVELASFDLFKKEGVEVEKEALELTVLGQEEALNWPDAAVAGGNQHQVQLHGYPPYPHGALNHLGQGLVDQWGCAVRAAGEIDGEGYNALLRAGDLVPIGGVGEQFSGLYYVTKIEHYFDEDPYRAGFQAMRNALLNQDDSYFQE